MSRVRNADDFLLRFREIRRNYDDSFAPLVVQVRKKYAGRPEKDLVDQNLEEHIRAYIVNALLGALNWRLDQDPRDGLPNLIPESPVRSEQKGTIRFLDYLGLERQTENPLLIVETKRPSAELPRTFKPAATYSEIVSRGLAGEDLDGDWNKWLEDVRDYMISVCARAQQAPKRVVIANGDWLILFLDPSDAFLEGGKRNPSLILVFKDHSDIERRFGELFLKLEYQRVLGETAFITPGELGFYIDPEAVDRAMHGLHLRYIEQQGIYSQLSPVLKVAPIVFLHSRYGSWLRVEGPPQQYELPHKKDQLTAHLVEVEQAAKGLVDEVNGRLGTLLQPLSIAGYYEDEEGYETLRGVRECEANEYLVVVGDKTHYLSQTISIADCPYHDWSTCNRAGIASNPGPIAVRSTTPRSFFLSGEHHHCAHRDVNSGKATPITSTNRSRCGPRSGRDGQAFCEIWGFEQHLCCRTCTFEEVCTKATVFHLPCRREGDNSRSD